MVVSLFVASFRLGLLVPGIGAFALFSRRTAWWVGARWRLAPLATAILTGVVDWWLIYHCCKPRW